MPRKPALATLSADATGTTRASAVYDALRAEYKTNKGGFTPKNGVLQWPFKPFDAPDGGKKYESGLLAVILLDTATPQSGQFCR